MKTLQQLNFTNERAVIRVDFNVPLNDQLEVTDPTRIEAAKPTITHVLSQGGSCVLLSHLGRPKGNDPKLSLNNITAKVSETLGVPVQFSSQCVGAAAEEKANTLKPGEVLLMENLRFHQKKRLEILVFQNSWHNSVQYMLTTPLVQPIERTPLQL